MSVEQLEEPGEWTVHGIAYCQVAIAHSDLIDVARLIRNGATAEASDLITTTIRQLEAARRMIA